MLSIKRRPAAGQSVHTLSLGRWRIALNCYRRSLAQRGRVYVRVFEVHGHRHDVLVENVAQKLAVRGDEELNRLARLHFGGIYGRRLSGDRRSWQTYAIAEREIPA